MGAVTKSELTGYRQSVKLLDGQEVTIRLITPDDKKALTEFHSRLSDECRFLRYHYTKGDLTSDDLINFCDVDYQDSMALVAERERNGNKEIIGVGRYYRLPSKSHTAEVAFVVQDSEQRKGIGTHLLKHLAILAWDKDIYFFLGEVLRENGRMLSIFRKADPEMYECADGSSTSVVTFSVSEAMSRTP